MDFLWHRNILQRSPLRYEFLHLWCQFHLGSLVLPSQCHLQHSRRCHLSLGSQGLLQFLQVFCTHIDVIHLEANQTFCMTYQTLKLCHIHQIVAHGNAPVKLQQLVHTQERLSVILLGRKFNAWTRAQDGLQ